MSDEIANQDIENTGKNLKSSEESMEVVKEMEKLIRSIKCSILWHSYEQNKITERFKLTDSFIKWLINLIILTSSTR